MSAPTSVSNLPDAVCFPVVPVITSLNLKSIVLVTMDSNNVHLLITAGEHRGTAAKQQAFCTGSRQPV